jgi:CRP/FNR family transcriptional regulator, cyclic AMP receptor protein
MLNQPFPQKPRVLTSLRQDTSVRVAAPQNKSEIGKFLIHAGLAGPAVSLQRKAVVFRQGTPADAAFFIQQGRVMLSAGWNDNSPATLALLGPGDFIGEECIASRQIFRPATATVLSRCTVVKIDRQLLEQKIRNDASVYELFMGLVMNRSQRMQEDLVAHLKFSSEQRLARLLLLMAGLTDSQEGEVTIAKVSHRLLAEMIGTTRSRVSFFMNRFRERGLIDYNGDFTIRAVLARVIAEESRTEEAS